MVFSSIPFLFCFLTLFFLCYFILPKQCRNYVLLLFSLVFYAWGEPVYVFLMIAVTGSDYLLGRLMHRFDGDEKKRKCCLVASVVIDLLLLGFFKYADFLIETVNCVPGVQFRTLGLALPIGISFFVFQSLSYTIDLYRREVTVEKSFPDYLMYVSMFPQLIAGPIVRYATVREELQGRRLRREDFFDGGLRFLQGLFKKVLLANQLGQLWDAAKALPAGELTVMMAWLGAVAFTLQLYLDFSAYSDMAIGLGRMLGFHFPENFRYPLAADSVTEFWRRWHISLSTWFRDYVYIPLGGNRVSVAKHLRNIAVVWFLTGLWHGASWNYILWGVYYGILLIFEKYVWGKRVFLLFGAKKRSGAKGTAGVDSLAETKIFSGLKKLLAVFRHIYLLFIVVLGFTVFALEDFNCLSGYLAAMFSFGGTWTDASILYYLQNYGVILLAAVLVSMPLAPKLSAWAKRLSGIRAVLVQTVTGAACLVLFLVTVAYLVADTYNPFLYFRF